MRLPALVRKDGAQRGKAVGLAIGSACVTLLSGSCSLGSVVLKGSRPDGGRSAEDTRGCPSAVLPLVDVGGAVLSGLAVAYLVENDCTKPNAPWLCTRNVEAGTWLFGGAAALFAVSAGVGLYQHATCAEVRPRPPPEQHTACHEADLVCGIILERR